MPSDDAEIPSDAWEYRIRFFGVALSLEGVEEHSYAGLRAFRVGSRKFASQAQGYGNMMLTLE